MSLKSHLKIEELIYIVALLSVVACATYFFFAFIYVAISRIHYPFSLDWVEGESFAQVRRILRGELLYDRPSYKYVALTYPPFYYYVSAVFARVIGLGFLPLRLVSLISSLGCMAVIYLICRKEGTGVLSGVIAGGFFSATFKISGYWFDVARIDMLAIFLLLVSIYLLRFDSLVFQIFAGIALTLACLTKQTNVLTLILLCAYFLLFDRRNSPGFLISSIASFSIASLLLNRIYSGWYAFFVFTSPVGSQGSPSITPSMIIQAIPDFWLNSILFLVPIATFFVLAYVWVNLRHLQNQNTFYFYIFCATGMIGTSWASLVHLGGYKNDLIPAFAVIAILFGLGLQRMLHEEQNRLHNSLWLGVCILQFIALYFPVAPQIPTLQDLSAGQSLIAEIREQPGDVYVPFHPELPLMAGKPTFASWNAMYQLGGGYGGGDLKEAQRVKTEFANAMARHEFAMIILDRDTNWVWGYPEKYYYMSTEAVFHDPDVFWPVVGWQNRPTFKMLPNRP
jgi:4-amino-4-deoxy-L-arabinose transferase-like glycosyltransferase